MTTCSLIYGPSDLPIEEITSDGSTHWFSQDQQGSTTAVTNLAGQQEATYTYDPYGNPTQASGTWQQPFLYNGQYTDPETGLQYLRARYYDPATAQFLTEDPLQAVTGQPYNYAGDDPLDETDPSGARSIFETIGQALFPGGGSTQICVGGTVSLYITVSVDGCFVQTPGGDAVTISPSVGVGAGAAINVHGGIGESNACRPRDYRGLISQGGGSAQFGEGGYYNRFSSTPFSSLSGARTVQGWTAGGSLGLGAEGGGGASYTFVIPIGGQSGGPSSSGCGC